MKLSDIIAEAKKEFENEFPYGVCNASNMTEMPDSHITRFIESTITSSIRKAFEATEVEPIKVTKIGDVFSNGSFNAAIQSQRDAQNKFLNQ